VDFVLSSSVSIKNTKKIKRYPAIIVKSRPEVGVVD
jgi:hypothetical protein